MDRNRFWHFDSIFDAKELVDKFGDAQRSLSPGHFVNFFGVKIDPKFFPTILHEGVEDSTVPANWHADLAEFGAALRAVDLSGPKFIAVELGCGWGCWLNITGAAARRSGREVFLQGVEGDATHIGYAQEALTANGFKPSDYRLHYGIAAASSGVALFPRQAGNNWSLAPIFQATEEQISSAQTSGTHDELTMVPLTKLAPYDETIDLLHMDIQGGEADLISSCIDFINAKVAYIVVGTHSRLIEGQIFEALTRHGWILEIDRPAIYDLNVEPPMVRVDGVQGWRNRRLRP